MKPRLLVLASTYPRWQGDHEPGFVHELCRRLTEFFDVFVVCPHAKGALRHEVLDAVVIHRFVYAPSVIETLVHDGGILSNLKHHPWKWLLLPGFLMGMFLEILKCFRHEKPEVIHAHWIIPQGLVLACLGIFCRKMPPILLTSHGGDLFALRNIGFRFLKQWILKRAGIVTVVSKPMSGLLEELGVSSDRIRVIPMGVDFQECFALDTDIARIPGRILFVGRLVEKKGVCYLIAALPKIIKSVPQTHLHIVGGGPDEIALREQVRVLGLEDKVTFLGPRPQHELAHYYHSASVFVAPFVNASSGDREGFGLVTVEAIACGCPVVVGDVPVISDIFLDSEVSMRAEPGNSSELAEKILAVLVDHETAVEKTMIVRQRLEQQIGWPSIIDGHVKAIKSCLC